MEGGDRWGKPPDSGLQGLEKRRGECRAGALVLVLEEHVGDLPRLVAHLPGPRRHRVRAVRLPPEPPAAPGTPGGVAGPSSDWAGAGPAWGRAALPALLRCG